jgi:hypothetical protein
MNEYMEIKELLVKYYEAASTDEDEQRLREYFTSGNVATELLPYRSIFVWLQHERENPSEKIVPTVQPRRAGWWYAAAAVAACLLGVVFFVSKHQPEPQTTACTGTYVMVDGICSDDLSLIRKYAVETIDLVTQPFEDSSPTDEPTFLNDE